MASRVEIILVPDLRSSAINAVGLLHSRPDLDVLLLDFPEMLEHEVIYILRLTQAGCCIASNLVHAGSATELNLYDQS